MAAINKDIQKEPRRISREAEDEKIMNMIKEFRGLKRIANIKTSKRRDHITEMADGNGKLRYSDKGIADALAD